MEEVLPAIGAVAFLMCVFVLGGVFALSHMDTKNQKDCEQTHIVKIGEVYFECHQLHIIKREGIYDEQKI